MEINEKKKESRISELSELRRLLKKGTVSFKYKKMDGTVRNANGTLKKVLIPKEELGDDRLTAVSDEVFYYYDIDKEDWRCFRKENFIKIKNKED